MLWLSKLFTGVLGSSFMPLVLGVIALVCAHQWTLEKDKRIQVAATNICDKAWESEIRRQERDAAQLAVTAAQSLLVKEREINKGLDDELETIRTQISSLRSGAGTSNNCLSDGVLRALEGSGSSATGKSRDGGASSGRAK